MAKFSLQQPGPQVTQPESEVDPAALNAFAVGAQDRRGVGEEAPPWEPFDPNDKPRYSVSLRLNEYQLAMLHYLATVLDISQHKILSKQLISTLQRLALEAFEAQRKAPR